jgi:hypothetical protein
MIAVAARPKRTKNLILENGEVPIELGDFGKLLPKRYSYHSVLSWAREGRMNRETREIVLLEVIRGPNGFCTSMEAYRRFLLALNNG